MCTHEGCKSSLIMLFLRKWDKSFIMFGTIITKMRQKFYIVRSNFLFSFFFSILARYSLCPPSNSMSLLPSQSVLLPARIRWCFPVIRDVFHSIAAYWTWMGYWFETATLLVSDHTNNEDEENWVCHQVLLPKIIRVWTLPSKGQERLRHADINHPIVSLY